MKPQQYGKSPAPLQEMGRVGDRRACCWHTCQTHFRYTQADPGGNDSSACAGRYAGSVRACVGNSACVSMPLNGTGHACVWDSVCVVGAHLPTVAPGEQDEHGARSDAGAQLPLVLAEGLLPVALQLAGHVLCGVVTGLVGGGETGTHQKPPQQPCTPARGNQTLSYRERPNDCLPRLCQE